MFIQEKKIKNKKTRVRLFIAYMLSNHFQEKLIQWKQLHTHLPVRWTPAENLHVTIIPPWYEQNLNIIEKLLEEHLTYPAFSLKFTDIGPGPSPENPRLIWTTAPSSDVILKLRKCAQRILMLPEEKQQFIPHITIGKFFPDRNTTHPFPPFHSHFVWTEHIKSIQLVQSFLHKDGAYYKVLKKIPLTSRTTEDYQL